jgi:hypothetical protein
MSQKEVLNVPALSPALQDAVDEWQSLTKWLETAKEREMELRTLLVSIAPKDQLTEGTNTVRTEDGWEFKIDRRVNRKLDETALDAVMSELPEDSPYRQLGVLVTYKPSLVLGGFRTMPEDQKLIFAQALTETDGAPALVISKPIQEGLDPATAPAIPDWPATAQGVPVIPAIPASAKFVPEASPKRKTAKKKAKQCR